MATEDENRIFCKYALISGVIVAIPYALYTYHDFRQWRKTLADKIFDGIFSMIGGSVVGFFAGVTGGTFGLIWHAIKGGTPITIWLPSTDGKYKVPDPPKSGFDNSAWWKEYQHKQNEILFQQQQESMRQSWRMQADAERWRINDDTWHRNMWYNR